MLADIKNSINFAPYLTNNDMTTSQIRAEIFEMVNAGIMNVGKITSYFKKNHPQANLETVKEEAKEIIADIKSMY